MLMCWCVDDIDCNWFQWFLWINDEKLQNFDRMQFHHKTNLIDSNRRSSMMMSMSIHNFWISSQCVTFGRIQHFFNKHTHTHIWNDSDFYDFKVNIDCMRMYGVCWCVLMCVDDIVLMTLCLMCVDVLMCWWLCVDVLMWLVWVRTENNKE